MTDTATKKPKRKRGQYGPHSISKDDFNLMVSMQDGKCSICKNEFETKSPPHLDHDHKTGVIRGALCRHCNFGLGFFRDNVEFLNNAIHYLQHHAKCPRPGESITPPPPVTRYADAMKRLANEDIIRLRDCGYLFDNKVSKKTINNYVTHGRYSKSAGCRVYLEVYRSPILVTSKQAIARFRASITED